MKHLKPYTNSKKSRRKTAKSYEKSTMVHHRYVCHKFHQSSSPVQDKARAVIRKYKHQMKQLEFKRLQKLVPSMDEMEDPTEVSSLIDLFICEPID